MMPQSIVYSERLSGRSNPVGDDIWYVRGDPAESEPGDVAVRSNAEKSP
jgi:hypothetical protein